MSEIEKKLEIEYLKEQIEIAEKECDSIEFFKLRDKLFVLQGHW